MSFCEKLGFIKRAIKNSIFSDYYIERAHKQTNDILLTNIPLMLAIQKFEHLTMHSVDRGITDCLYDDRELVVSLTTHSKRIHSVFHTIESIFQQTYKPNRVVLYVNEDKFSEEELPETLKMQMKRGLEVRFVKDVRSYTKLVYALVDFPEANIITVDDDLMYPFDMIERLVKAHLHHPEAICSIAARTMIKLRSREFDTYQHFQFEDLEQDQISTKYIAEGFAGVLYPPHSLHEDVTNAERFLELAPHTDDLWFKAMSLLKGTPILLLHRDFPLFHNLFIDEDVQDIGLINQNVFAEHRNDKELKQIFDFYNLYDKIEA